MRDILFRGKSSCTSLYINQRNWVYGSLIKTEHGCLTVNGIIECNEEYISLVEGSATPA